MRKRPLRECLSENNEAPEQKRVRIVTDREDVEEGSNRSSEPSSSNNNSEPSSISFRGRRRYRRRQGGGRYHHRRALRSQQSNQDSNNNNLRLQEEERHGRKRHHLDLDNPSTAEDEGSFEVDENTITELTLRLKKARLRPTPVSFTISSFISQTVDDVSVTVGEDNTEDGDDSSIPTSTFTFILPLPTPSREARDGGDEHDDGPCGYNDSPNEAEA